MEYILDSDRSAVCRRLEAMLSSIGARNASRTLARCREEDRRRDGGTVLTERAALKRDLCRVVSRERIISSPDELLVYGYDGAWLDSPPVAVVSPVTVDEVAAVVKLADRLRLPVVPRGGGSGLAGGAVGQGGLILKLTMMDRILEIDPASRVACVEPGVINARFQAEVEAIARRYDLLIPLFGHIGDGNLHPNILCDLRDDAEMARVVTAAEDIFAAALLVGGTLSGEHGIGLLKRQFLQTAIAEDVLDLSRRL
jgi:FAD/FMN-containing dehydrogenase